VSFTWRAGQITSATITFNSNHPWLAGQTEDTARPGFFRSNIPPGQRISDVDSQTGGNTSGTAGRGVNTGGQRSASVTLSSPNGLRMYLSSTPLSAPDPLSHPIPAPVPRCVLSAEHAPSVRYSRTERRKGGGAERRKGPGDDVSSHWIEGIPLSLSLSLSFSPSMNSIQ
jgi:hypothetical protein